jgi:hypothetical protein
MVLEEVRGSRRRPGKVIGAGGVLTRKLRGALILRLPGRFSALFLTQIGS